MAVGAQRRVGIDESARTVVVIEVDTRVVAHHQQVEVRVGVEIDEAAGVGAPKALLPEPCRVGRMAEAPLAVVEQQV